MSEELSDFEKGVILGVLIGGGHFGGDGKQPQVTLRMNVRHERLLTWLNERIRWSRLFGPYHHQGRHFLQLMVRGPALREELGPLLYQTPWAEIDDHSYGRFIDMLSRYGILEGIVSPSGSP
jgi:hypothetical protein